MHQKVDSGAFSGYSPDGPQLNEEPRRNRGRAKKTLVWFAIALAVLLIVGLVGGSSMESPAPYMQSSVPATEKPAKATHTHAPTTEAPTPATQPPAQTAAPVKSSETFEQRNAINMAKSYLEIMPFSRRGLIEQLEYEHYSHEDAVYAVDHCGADWNEQAIRSAKSYLEIMPFSRQELIDQLKYEGFTDAQAAYGVTGAGY